MASTFKNLGVRNPAANALEDMYTVPALTSAISPGVVVCNRGAAPTTFRVARSPLGAAIALSHYLAYDYVIQGNETVQLPSLTMAATDVVRVLNLAGTCSFTLDGEEIT